MGKKYVVESQFEDLHGNPDDSDLELDVDLSDSDNPIIRAALGGEDENWKPPAKDDVEDDEEEVEGDEDDEEESEDDEDDSEDEDDDDSDEDEDGDDDEDEDEDDEDDGTRYSKKVQKRIDRERELRRQEKEAADRRIRKMEKKLELRDAKDEQRDKERELEGKLNDLRAKKREAIEEGSTDDQVDIDEQILDIKTEIRSGKSKIEKLEKELETEDFDDAGSATPPAGQKWLQKYPEFHSNQKFRDAVLRADQLIAQQGYDKNTDDYYAKIEEIVNVTFPEIVKKRRVKVTKRKTNKRKKRPAVSGSQKPGTRRKANTRRKRRGVVRLTKADQANMKIFGMDPSNPEHAKAYAESKED